MIWRLMLAASEFQLEKVWRGLELSGMQKKGGTLFEYFGVN